MTTQLSLQENPSGRLTNQPPRIFLNEVSGSVSRSLYLPWFAITVSPWSRSNFTLEGAGEMCTV